MLAVQSSSFSLMSGEQDNLNATTPRGLPAWGPRGCTLNYLTRVEHG
jgi:hypothetical protein